ncbi:YopX family protein [Jeotgalibaca porci]|uniref:YopX family protein n=1 Tax=Jeotgalibaca porci TaxID=1868793 RepID=UPI0035A1B365
MREINFRAYSKRTKKMYNVLVIFFYQKVVKLSKTCGSGISFLEQLDDVVLMQYIGLKDKNGVEIYEGDIVAIENHPFQKTDDSDAGMEINGNYEVGWNADDLTWCAGSLLLARVKSYVRVIGNIHENPDLLEESK